jgi:hypothetical protein
VAVLVAASACNRNDTPRDQQAGNITLTGCLQTGEQGLASPPPEGAAANADQFVLANAKTPAQSADPNASTGPLYILDGNKDEFRQHVSQQVEVTGELKDSAAGSPQRFDVDSVRMIAATCAR